LGAVWLARATGNPLLPFHSEAASSWTLNSWDRTQIPRPFTTVATVVGTPIYVPRDADEPALNESRLALEASLAAARIECHKLLA
jgi:3-deoxy-D-manno-octulosonic-acid transferase